MPSHPVPNMLLETLLDQVFGLVFDVEDVREELEASSVDVGDKLVNFSCEKRILVVK